MLFSQANAIDRNDPVAGPFKVTEISLFMQVAPLAENFERRVPTLWLRGDPLAISASSCVRWLQLRWPAKSVALDCRIPLLSNMRRILLLMALPTATATTSKPTEL